MSKRALAVLAMVILFVAMAVGVAGAAYTTNAECISCHQPGGSAVSQVDFHAAAPVNKVTACKKCHWEPTAGHPFHNPTWNCVSCHFEMGTTNFAAIPKYYSDTYDAFFNSAESANTDTETLHIIHANPRWAATVTKNGRQCASCHSAANCTACHEGAIDRTHEDHTWDAALKAYWPGWGPSATKFGAGTPKGIETKNSVIPALSCSNSTCHSVASGAYLPTIVEDTNLGITYSTSPAWSRGGATGYSANTYRIANGAGARAQYAFTGQKIEFYSDRHPYRGKARILIDSVEVTTVDLYSAVVEKQYLAYTGVNLGSGVHTITVEVTNQKNTLSRGYYVVVDCFRVFPKTGMERTSCLVCHSPAGTDYKGIDRYEFHAAPLDAHQPSNVDCTTGSGCHPTYDNIWTGHSLRGDTCATCHRNSVIATETVGWTFRSDLGITITKDCVTCHNTTVPDLGDKTTPTDKTLWHGVQHALTPNTSDYDNVTVTGCLDAGVGCHGAESSANIADYHKDKIGCTSGACHTSSTKLLNTHLEPFTCADCHNGTYNLAANVNALAAAAPNGHYSETSHTAAPSSRTASVTAGGTMSARCEQCHSPVNGGGGLGSLWYQHQALPTLGDTTCSDCHNANVNVTLEITGKWTNNACSDCHKVGVLGTMIQHTGATPVNGSATHPGEDGCGNAAPCHGTWDLHALHKGNGGVSDPTCDACHDYTAQALKPTIKNCNTCHFDKSNTNHGTKHTLTRVSSVYVNSTQSGCLDTGGAGCHDGLSGSSTNVVDYHIDKTSCIAGACHTSSSYPKASPFTCTSCHDGTYVNAIDTTALLDAAPGGHYDGTLHTAASMGTTMGAGGPTTAACSSCHSGSSLYAQHQGTEAGTATCTECHNVNAAVSGVVKASWSGKACSACHSGGTLTGMDQHATTAPVVEGTASTAGANSCGNAGCHNSWDLHAVHKGNGVTPEPGCNAAALGGSCHDYGAQGIKPTQKSCNVCHSDKTNSNHGAQHELTANTSDYNNGTVAGCLDAGAGCHGAESSANIADYHKDKVGCLSGACHTSSTKLLNTHLQPFTCADCHDGTYNLAANVNALAAASPNGHYSETTHTAVGMTGTVLGAADGLASATCADCHDPVNSAGIDNLWFQHQALPLPYGDTTCSDCHNANVNVTMEITGNWTNNTCADCHKLGVLPTMIQHGAIATAVTGSSGSNAGCGDSGVNCHGTNNWDLHALHKGNGGADPSCSGGAGARACHDYTKQGAKPTTKDCDTCHVNYGTNGHYDTAKHQSATQGASTAYQGIACSACHVTTGSNMELKQSHEATYATMVPGGVAPIPALQICYDCHNNAGSTTAVASHWSTKACAECHDGSGIAAAHTSVTATHTATSTGCSSSGTGCHNSNNLFNVGAVTTVNSNIHSACLRCHDKTAASDTWSSGAGIVNLQYKPTSKTCGNTGGTCHNVGYNNTTFVHTGKAGTADGTDGAHHLADATSMATTLTWNTASARCDQCHDSTMSASHTGTTAATCAGCHNSDGTTGLLIHADAVVKSSWATKTCAECHGAPNGNAYHNTYTAAAHTGTSSTGCLSGGTGCHGTDPDLRTIHQALKGTATTFGCLISGCHDAKNGDMTGSPKACEAVGCHSTYTDATHYSIPLHSPTTTTQRDATWAAAPATTCGSCHVMELGFGGTGARTEHGGTYSKTSTNANITCVQCHTAGASVVALSWSQKNLNTACAQCHTGVAAISAVSPIHVDASSTAHANTTSAGCGGTGTGCHPTNDLSQIGTPSVTANIHTGCLRCHDRTATATTWTSAMLTTPANMQWNPALDTCGGTECHTSAYYNPAAGATQYQHRIGQPTVVTGIDTDHHLADATSMATSLTWNTASARCDQCHASTMTASHATSAVANTCLGCHNSNGTTGLLIHADDVVKSNWSPKTCDECHGTHGNAKHNTYTAAAHTGTSTQGCTNSGAGCHGTETDLRTLHQARTGSATTFGCLIAGCHDSVGKEMSGAAKSCGVGGVCHNTYTASSHGGTVTGNETTHTAIAMTTILDPTYDAGGANTCANCHSAGLALAHKETSTTLVLKSGNTGWGITAQAICSDCHNATAPDNSVTVVKTDRWSAQTCDQCHETAGNGGNGNGKHALYASNHVGTHPGWTCTNSCHPTDLRALHNNSVTSNASTAGCDSAGCHDAVDKVMTGSSKTCGSGNASCHQDKTDSNHGYNVAMHTATAGQSIECFDCHASYDLKTVHGGDSSCVVCHGGKYGDIGRAVLSAECIACHNSARMPGRSWIDTTTVATLGQRVLPHYNSQVTSHTVASWDSTSVVSNTGNYACTQCHSVALYAAHSGPTSISIDTSATYPRNTRCTACHSVVTAWGRPSYGKWAAQPAGEKCSACHSVATSHTQYATKHDASNEQMPSPGSTPVVTASTTVVVETFGTSTTWPTSPTTWTRSSTTRIMAVTTPADHTTGTGASARINQNSATRTSYSFVNTTGWNMSSYTVATVRFWFQTGGTGWTTADSLLVEYTVDGTTWQTLLTQTAAQATWSEFTATGLPVGSNVKIRFTASLNSNTNDWALIDDIVISGTTSSGGALPANSTALVSCQNNPNGTECHVVSDVAAIHANTAAKCTVCHVNSTTAPKLNCQTAACHPGVNRDEHTQTGFGSPAHHENGGVFATWAANGECRGCHDDSIAAEHAVLTAYTSKPCSVCHATNYTVGTYSPAKANVTAAIASRSISCTVCHISSTATTPHVRRNGYTGALGLGGQFDATYSGHRVYAGMPGAKTAFGTVAGVNVTSWALPANTTWLKSVAVAGQAAAQLTPTSMVWCSDCHGSITGAVGPHGATMRVGYAIRTGTTEYDNSYTAGTLYNLGTGFSNTTALCNKCHVATSQNYNAIHGRGEHQGSTATTGRCTACHIKIPHGWKRPRLLGYNSGDVSPYNTTALTQITVTATKSNDWGQAECQSSNGCSSHGSLTAPMWP
jgi:hypothetical protein